MLQARGTATLSSDKKWETYYFVLNADATLQIFAAVPNESPVAARKAPFGSKQSKTVDFSTYSRGQVTSPLPLFTLQVFGSSCPYNGNTLHNVGEEEETAHTLLFYTER